MLSRSLNRFVGLSSFRNYEGYLYSQLIQKRVQYFSTRKSYDLVTIGPYANRVAKQFSKKLLKTQGSVSILTIEQQPIMYQPALLPYSFSSSSSHPKSKPKSLITLDQNNHEFGDIEKGVKIKDIQAEFNRIVLSNGTVIGYRELVYSGYPQDWLTKNTKISNDQNIKNNNTFKSEEIIDEDDIESIRGWPSRIKDNDQIVFTIPKSAHYGYNNYFFLVLQNIINSNSVNKNKSITVVCEDDGLFSFSPELNTIMEQHLRNSNIKIYRNVQFSVDKNKKCVNIMSEKRSVQVNNKNAKQDNTNSNMSIGYNHIFSYQRLSTPKILGESDIQIQPPSNSTNIFSQSLNPLTYSLSKYPSMHIISPLHSVIWSPQTIAGISSVIAHNIMFNLYGINKRAIYTHNNTNSNININVWHTRDHMQKVKLSKDGKIIKQNKNMLGAWMGGIGDIVNEFKCKNYRDQVQAFINKGESKVGGFDYKPQIIQLVNKESLQQAYNRVNKSTNPVLGTVK